MHMAALLDKPACKRSCCCSSFVPARLQVAVKVAKSVAECRDPTKPAGAYEYCQFLQVEWQAYHRIMNAEGAAPDMGFPCMLGAGD